MRGQVLPAGPSGVSVLVGNHLTAVLWASPDLDRSLAERRRQAPPRPAGARTAGGLRAHLEPAYKRTRATAHDVLRDRGPPIQGRHLRSRPPTAARPHSRGLSQVPQQPEVLQPEPRGRHPTQPPCYPSRSATSSLVLHLVLRPPGAARTPASTTCTASFASGLTMASPVLRAQFIKLQSRPAGM